MNEEMYNIEEQFYGASEELQNENNIETSKYLIFLTDNLKIGVDANNVESIITSYSITYLPMMPEFIRGIINLRGQMMPILDIRLRLGKEPKEDGLVIVLNIDGTPMGILVDAVDQMTDIPKDGILPMPARSTQRLVNGMCTIPDGSGTMLVLDCEQLLNHG